MTTQLPVAAVRQITTVYEDEDWGANGVLDAGDRVLWRDGLYRTVTEADVASDSALDAFLENVTGAKIDLVRDPSKRGRPTTYLVYRKDDDWKTSLRILDVVSGHQFLPDPANYEAPDSWANLRKKESRRVYECWGEYSGVCVESLNWDYNYLAAGAAAYASAYNAYNSALSRLAAKSSLTWYDIEGSSGILPKAVQYERAKQDYVSRLENFNRPRTPWPLPLPPESPDNRDDDWGPTPQVPPTPPTPQNPDNRDDDW